MNTLEKIRTIVEHLLEMDGQEIVHKYEFAIWLYMLKGSEWEEAKDAPYDAIWDKTKKFIDKRADLDEPKLRVSEVIDLNDLKWGKLNLVYSPCGSGKTYFVENILKGFQEKPHENMLYLAPTRSLVEALKFRGKPFEKTDEQGRLIVEWRQAGITAMTYAAFGSMVKRARDEGTGRGQIPGLEVLE